MRKMINKLRKNLSEALLLNEYFMGRSVNTYQDIDIIATYLASSLGSGLITEDMLNDLPKLVKQLSNSFEKIQETTSYNA
jgi:hypothetical protein